MPGPKTWDISLYRKRDMKGNKNTKIIVKSWPAWLSWLEHCPITKRLWGLIPSQGTIEKATN